MVLQRIDGGIAVMSLQLYTADDLPAQPPPPRSGQAAATLDMQSVEVVLNTQGLRFDTPRASSALPQPGRR